LERVSDLPQILTIANGWRPFRSWISVMLRAALEDATHEILGVPCLA